MSTTSLFDILSELRGTKLTKVAQIDRVIDWASVGAVIETVYTKGSAPTGRPSYDGLMLFKIELLHVWRHAPMVPRGHGAARGAG